MSCFVMSGRTLSIIAGYLADAANEDGHRGVLEGVRMIAPPTALVKCLKDGGCLEDGEFKAERVYALLFDFNKTAYKERYGECEDWTDPFCPVCIDERESTRKEWLSNLFTVCRCYGYQIAEGMVCESAFFAAFSEWVDQMAYALADMTVKEVRPSPQSDGYRSWEEF